MQDALQQHERTIVSAAFRSQQLKENNSVEQISSLRANWAFLFLMHWRGLARARSGAPGRGWRDRHIKESALGFQIGRKGNFFSAMSKHNRRLLRLRERKLFHF